MRYILKALWWYSMVKYPLDDENLDCITIICITIICHIAQLYLIVQEKQFKHKRDLQNCVLFLLFLNLQTFSRTLSLVQHNSFSQGAVWYLTLSPECYMAFIGPSISPITTSGTQLLTALINPDLCADFTIWQTSPSFFPLLHRMAFIRQGQCQLNMDTDKAGGYGSNSR